MSTLLFASLIVFVYMSVFFLIAVARKDNSLADVAWGGGFILVALATFFRAPGEAEARQVLATGLVIVWGVRLAVHIYFRNRGKAEDFRYAKWRRDWGKYFLLRSYLQVFLLQGALLVVIAWSVIFINMHPARGLSFLDALGLLVWATGFFFEAVGDYQLLRFTREPANKGRVMTTGLWRYTRHPNYFGEATMWWGIFLMALPLEGGYAALVSPLTITFLLLKVSGIPMLEKKLMETQEGYAEYARRTNAFVPWFPREPE